MSQQQIETASVIQEANWSAFHASIPADDSEIVTQLFDMYPFQSEQDHQDLGFGASSMFWSDNANGNSNVYFWSQGDSNSSFSTSTSNPSYFLPHSDYQSYYLNESNAAIGISTTGSAPMDFSLVEEQHENNVSVHVAPYSAFSDQMCLNEEISSNIQGDSIGLLDQLKQPKRKSFSDMNEKLIEDYKFDTPAASPKKKLRTTSTQIKKCEKKEQSKRAQKSIRCGDEEENNAALNGQSSSCDSSDDDDSNGSQEMNGEGSTISTSKGSHALNLDGKSRAGRGSATDPQSLYARKRRERINERLRTLQNLVPNGTKVDISTMLEEAVQYVKFLQLQIKLLSSDELWMYAPIAYNGLNIGFDLKISPHQP
ncbi:uncharacterized protein [Typha angustifolia]|uniref:uncharacterized protein n=1 Tax=Typha angustifolia TaxID=59011 RepID=UPI003C2E759D